MRILGFGFRVQNLPLNATGTRKHDWSPAAFLKVKDSGFRIQGSGFRV